MNISKEKIQFFSYIINKKYYKFLRTELSKYIQHGKTNTYQHCRNVAYASYKFAKKFFKNSIDYESLVNAAFMHDMFLYDWHEKSTTHRLHGFTHPHVAAINAEKYCSATKKEISIIESHMWPLTITKIPKSKEAFILCLCDKAVTIAEVFS